MFQYIRIMWGQKAQGVVEYALILAFVVAIAVIALGDNSTIGNAVKNLFNDTGNTITNASSSAPTNN
ncbi:hypothetical protein SELR_00260 [Selenomonas ruminantium subsp. lactilytica TAM6421]|uniref:Pilus assembly protein Flp/PilA n=1 Tax=Selenomonas ruminantium subsp. lactilytica (strain NBRC 103574 / TAM6421) TaxID=927704 RepID=I0GLU7_SELRL|nr:hypothetical protein [Selenomonas ruminantium]BAL81734.1 hypothetical protein SELR_00260 [Selenomonas ruminantium subsp. lactilytica TAM6421]